MAARAYDWGFLLVSVLGFLLAIFHRRAGSLTGAFYEAVGMRILRLPDRFYQAAFLLGGGAMGVLALLAFLARVWR